MQKDQLEKLELNASFWWQRQACCYRNKRETFEQL